MLWTVVGVLVGVVLLVMFAPLLLELFILIMIGLSWLMYRIEENIKALNTQLVWALAGCSVLGGIVLLFYLLR